MSVEVMSKVWKAELPRPEKFILLCLADFGNDEGESIYPSLGYIAWKTGYKETQARDILQSLAGKGIITTNQRASKYGTNQYTIHVDRLPVRDPYQPPKMGRPEKVGAETDPSLEKVGAEIEKVGAVFEKVGAETEPDPLDKPLGNPLETLAGASFSGAGTQPKTRRTAAKIKGDGVDFALMGAAKGRPDVSAYPEDVQPVIQLYCEQYDQKPPVKMKGSDIDLWIQDARLLIQAGGDKTLEVLKDLKANPYEWMKTAMIARPGALIKAVRARAGEIRQKTDEQVSPEEDERIRKMIREHVAKRRAEGSTAFGPARSTAV